MKIEIVKATLLEFYQTFIRYKYKIDIDINIDLCLDFLISYLCSEKCCNLNIVSIYFIQLIRLVSVFDYC